MSKPDHSASDDQLSVSSSELASSGEDEIVDRVDAETEDPEWDHSSDGESTEIIDKATDDDKMDERNTEKSTAKSPTSKARTSGKSTSASGTSLSKKASRKNTKKSVGHSTAADDKKTAKRVGVTNVSAKNAEQKNDGSDNSRALGVTLIVAMVVLIGSFVFIFMTNDHPPAFTVYGEETSRAALVDRIREAGLEDLADTAERIEGASNEEQAQVAAVINTLITYDVIAHKAEERAVTVDERDVDQYRDALIVETFGDDVAAFEQALSVQGLSDELVRIQFRTSLLAEGILADEIEIDDDEVEMLYNEVFTEPVVAVIHTAEQEAADRARQRIDSGESFRAVAEDVSIDPSSGTGGVIGPRQPGLFPPDIDAAVQDAQIGDVFGPFELEGEGGFLLVSFDDPPTLEEAAPTLRDSLRTQRLQLETQELASDIEDEAGIAVDEAFGTWAGLRNGGIIPDGIDIEVDPPTGGE